MLPENALTTPVVSGVDQRLFRGAYRVGMLGGGQLGRMLIQAGLPFNLAVHVLDPQSDAPCRHVCHRFVTGDFSDHRTVVEFGRELDLVTLEIEHVDVDALETLKAAGVRVCPDPALVRTVQDKGLQKQFYQEHDLPTAAFTLLEGRQQLRARADLLPCVQKSRLAGYDGKGVAVIDSVAEIDRALDLPCVVEAKVDIEAEVSVLVARNRSGQVKTYPPVEMVVNRDRNLLDYLCCPARIEPDEQARATGVALSLAEKLDLVGLLAVEMFVTREGDVLINEVAPRPHNSGHHTIETSNTSQYEQHLRAIFDFSLGSTEMLFPAVMVNIIGARGHTGPVVYEGIEPFLEVAGVHLHLYGKKLVQPFRKMGHVTIVRPEIDEAIDIAKRIRQEVKAVSCQK